MSGLKLPSREQTVWLIAIWYWLFTCSLGWMYLNYLEAFGKLTRDELEADGLGNLLATLVWLIESPVYWVIWFWILNHYPRNISLFVWDHKRNSWSWCWTLFFGFAIGHRAFFSAKYLIDADIFVLRNLLGMYVWMLARAAVVGRYMGDQAQQTSIRRSAGVLARIAS